MMRRRGQLAAVVSCGLIPVFASPLAGEPPVAPGERFTLGGYVPPDAWMYTHFVRNPERDWIDSQWREVFEALRASGVDRDVAAIVLGLAGDADREEVQTTLEKWARLIRDVRWADLIYEEVAFAERLGQGASTEYLLLMRGRAASAEANMERLGTLFEEVAALTDRIHLVRRDQADLGVLSLRFSGKVPGDLSIELFRRGDVIGVTTTPTSLRDVSGLLSGENSGRSILASTRFVEALRSATPPEDGLVFFDFQTLIRSLNRMMTAAAARRGAEGGADDEARAIAVFNKALSLCNVLDYSLVTVETRGRRELSHGIMRIQQGKQKCALACCWLDRKLFARFDRFIPAEATGFALDGSVNLQALYETATTFVAKDVPNGKQHLARWNEWLGSIGFDPERDLFSWWSGEMIRVSLPGSAAAAIASPTPSGEWVWMFRVKDGELASAKVTAGLEFARSKLQERGQLLMVSPARTAAEGFRQISHPMLMMFFNPVVGVKDNWLMVGSSSAAVDKCLAVAAGKAPSIRQNERFREEGLIPDGPVLSLSFKDTSRFGEEVAAQLGVAGVIGGVVTGVLPDNNPEARRAKQLIQGVVSAVMKLGPVFRQIDFYSSEASVCTYDGERTIRTERVVTYKAPPSDDGAVRAVKAR